MLCVLIISALAVASLARPNLDVQLDKHWEMWKDYQNKVYSDKHEELERRMVWQENYKMINLHNLEHDMGKHSYTLGMNQFGDMTLEEFIAWNNLVKQPKKQMKFGGKYENSKLEVPDEMDWRKHGYVTPVKDQGQCGSCWSFSATGSLEGQYFKVHNTLLSFSEQQLIDCSRPEGDYGCNGGLMDDAFKYIEKNKIEVETDYPYEAQDDTCRYQPSLGVTEVSDYTDVEAGSEDALKTAIGTDGPVSVAIDASHQSFQLYKSGVYDEPACSSEQLDHGVLAIGYGTDAATGLDYWLVKNSWNTVWGNEGYIMMSRNKDNQCGIATSASYPTVK